MTLAEMRAERVNRGLSLRQAGALIGVSGESLRLIEAGSTRPNPSTGRKIADFYGVQVTDIWPVEDRTAA